jgi:pimeloyl-ACP methyl ester carboxylesterase
VATFALVHGAWHGGWNWDLLVPELRARGHRVEVADYPQDQLGTVWETYVDAVLSAVSPLAEPPILVGHSLGAAVAAIVATRVPVSLLVYLCPNTAFTDRPVGGPMRVYPCVFDRVHEEGGFDWWDPADAKQGMYRHLDPETATWAAERLQRSTAHGPYPLAQAPAVPSAYVYATKDEFFTTESSRWRPNMSCMSGQSSWPGGHFPHLERPGDLAALLSRLATGAG